MDGGKVSIQYLIEKVFSHSETGVIRLFYSPTVKELIRKLTVDYLDQDGIKENRTCYEGRD